MEKLLEAAWVGLKVGEGRASGNHQSRVYGVSQVDGDSELAPTYAYRLCVERAQFRNRIVDRAALPLLTLQLDNWISETSLATPKPCDASHTGASLGIKLPGFKVWLHYLLVP